MRGETSPPLQIRQPGAHRLDDAQPAPFAGAVADELPSVAHTGSADAGIAGKIPGSDHAPEHAAMFGNRARSANASRVPSAHPIASIVMTRTHIPAEQTLSAGQRLPHAPQLFTSSPSVTHSVPHSVLPLAQVAWHTPVRHTCPAGQARPHVPQFSESLARLRHAPPHIVVPSGHEHIPATHDAPVTHAFPQRPQFAVLMAMLTSQPFAALPSQFAKPVLQVSPQVLIAHVGVALGGVGHTAPQRPQLFRSVVVLTSQPFAALPSQFAKPVLQVNPQVPIAHVGVALGGVGHKVPQRPQCIALVPVLTSQPFAALPSQFAKPVLQVSPQTPIAHVPVAFGGVGHAVPHIPQFAVSVCVSTQVIIAPRVHRIRGAGQSIRHAPATHI